MKPSVGFNYHWCIYPHLVDFEGLADPCGEFIFYIVITMYFCGRVIRVTSVMNIHDMTIEHLLNIEVTSVEQGKQLAEDILQEQLAIHREMISLYDNEKWQVLSDRHYDLRKIRVAVLTLTGKMAIARKRATQR